MYGNVGTSVNTYYVISGPVENVLYYKNGSHCAIAIDCSTTTFNCNEENNKIYHLTYSVKMCEFAERCKIQEMPVEMTIKNEIVYNQFKTIESISYANTKAILPNKTIAQANGIYVLFRNSLKKN